MRPFYRAIMDESGAALLFGLLTVLAIVAAMTWFKPSDPIIVADNGVTISAPVTEDTAGPVLNDSGLPDRERVLPAPLADRDR